jgi:protein-S-isoprenylcysteine O-methyltransferase Ste14
VRHPFYASYLLTWLGGAIVSEQGWLFLAPLVMGAIYEHSARAEKAKFLRSALAGEYRRYMQRTGRFLPRIFSTHTQPTPP